MPFSRWLLLTIPGFVVSALLLAFTIRSLLRTLSRSVVVTIPLQASQSFRLDEPGPYDLFVEGGVATNDFVGLHYALTDAAGRTVPMSGVLFRAHARSFSRSRLQVQSFEAATPGVYALQVTGLHRDSAPDNRILVSRPVRAAMVGHILGLIVLGAATIGSMVATGLLIFGPDRRGPG
jgi:hypothetical protein